MRYQLYNDDVLIATFEYGKGEIKDFVPSNPRLLPMQLSDGSPGSLSLWLQARGIDVDVFLHRELLRKLMGTRDKIAAQIDTHLFSVTDTFTCFPDGQFIQRDKLCRKETQDAVSDFILISSDTSLRLQSNITPNASTDGSFLKTWRHEEGAWWLYKRQDREATMCELMISRALKDAGFSTAEYDYAVKNSPARGVKTRNFVPQGVFFEPYDSYRFRFDDKQENEKTIYRNIAQLGEAFERDFRRILLADALFMNVDRHMRNFGVLRSANTGNVLSMAPNFDNNLAYKSNKGSRYTPAMLDGFQDAFGFTQADAMDLAALAEACGKQPYLFDARDAGMGFLGRM